MSCNRSSCSSSYSSIIKKRRRKFKKNINDNHHNNNISENIKKIIAIVNTIIGYNKGNNSIDSCQKK